jgi:alkylhydroperoxidase family enzyme
MTAPIIRDVTGRPSEPRIPPVAAEDMTETQRTLAGIGASNVIRTLVRHEDLLNATNPLGLVLLSSRRITARDRELVIARVALRTGAAYEWANHAPAALATGVTEAEIRALTDPEFVWPDTDAALLGAADDLCADDCVSGATWALLRATRDDQQVIELLVLVGYYRLMAGVLNSTGVAIEPGKPAYGEPPVVHRIPTPRPAPGAHRADGAPAPAGTWAIVYHHPTGDQEITLVLDARDGQVTGSATNTSNGIATTITDGTIDGDRFSCTSVLITPARIELVYSGTVDGDMIAGEVLAKGFGAVPFEGARAS